MEPLVLALITLLLTQAPSTRAMLDQIEAQEELNDLLEDHFDAVCGALKSGRRVLSPDLTDEGAWPPLRSIVWATACSLRALELKGAGPRRNVHLLWEVEGRDAAGARVSERGEADGEVRREKGKWRLASFVPTTAATIRREVPRFVEGAQQAGLVMPPRRGDATSAELNSAGLTVRDVDGDGRPEVIALEANRAFLFRNVGPGLAFTRELLLEAPASLVLTAAIAGDYDEDSDADLVVTAYAGAPSWLLRNDGGKFVVAGRLPPGGRFQSGIASDLDGDGHLDLALLSYRLAAAAIPSDLLKAENGEPIQLFRGDGALGFTPWPIPAAAQTTRWSLAAVAGDLLGQGRPQLFVANDFGDKDLWRFEADGGARNVAAELGLEDPGNGMSADLGDLDGDGRLDLHVANMFSKAGTRVLAGASTRPELMERMKKFARGNTTYLAQSDGGYLERGEALGINRGLWAYGSLMTDTDDDGRLEVVVANGFYSHPKRRDL